MNRETMIDEVTNESIRLLRPGQSRPHSYSTDSACEPSRETADYLLASHIRQATEGASRRRREPIWPAVLQAASIFILAIVIAVKL